jgi:hypothetical protein
VNGVYKTQFEIETDKIIAYLDNELDDRMQKFVGASDRLYSTDLRKRGPADYEALSKAFSELQKCFGELNKLMDRRQAALPEFRAWALGQQAVDHGRFAMVEKSGEVADLFEPKAPIVDPATKVGDVELHHRFNQKENP